MAKERRRGTTLAELLVAVLFLAVCVTGIVACVAGSQRNANYMRRRAVALATASNEIETAVSEAKAGTLSAGTDAAVTVSALPGPGQYVRKVSKVSGSKTLYSVNVTLTWKEPTSNGSRNESFALTTLVRCPDG